MVAMKIKWVNTYEVLRTMSNKCSKYSIKMYVMSAVINHRDIFGGVYLLK